jgi:hypothetical protein
MNFLFHTAIGVNSEMAYYNVFHIGGGKYKLELQDSSFTATNLSSGIVIWKNIHGWQSANRIAA